MCRWYPLAATHRSSRTRCSILVSFIFVQPQRHFVSWRGEEGAARIAEKFVTGVEYPIPGVHRASSFRIWGMRCWRSGTRPVCRNAYCQLDWCQQRKLTTNTTRYAPQNYSCHDYIYDLKRLVTSLKNSLALLTQSIYQYVLRFIAHSESIPSVWYGFPTSKWSTDRDAMYQVTVMASRDPPEYSLSVYDANGGGLNVYTDGDINKGFGGRYAFPSICLCQVWLLTVRIKLYLLVIARSQ